MGMYTRPRAPTVPTVNGPHKLVFRVSLSVIFQNYSPHVGRCQFPGSRGTFLNAITRFPVSTSNAWISPVDRPCTPSRSADAVADITMLPHNPVDVFVLVAFFATGARTVLSVRSI